MPRPRKWRHVRSLPPSKHFGPLGPLCPWGPPGPQVPGGTPGRQGCPDTAGPPAGLDNAVRMTVDEYEAIRLIDLEGLTQEECAVQMNVARTTIQGIYSEARKKLATSLVSGRMLLIEGGDYRLCDDPGPAPNGGFGRRHRNGRHGRQ